MVNSSEFVERLKKVASHYDLTASMLADKIGVQRSSISHILSGRNKPSLDFVLKITESFEEVDLYWLLNGKGTFPNSPTPASSQDSGTLFHNESSRTDREGKQIDRIVVFYKDGTFSEFLSS